MIDERYYCIYFYAIIRKFDNITREGIKMKIQTIFRVMTAIAFMLAAGTGAAAQSSAVTVGTQHSELWTRTTGSNMTQFTVTTNNIDNKAEGSVQWYSNAAGTASVPIAGLQDLNLKTEVSTGSATRTLTVKTNQTSGKTTPAGTYYFRVTIGGVKSNNVGTLLIKKPTVTIGTQEGEELREGRPGTAIYAIAGAGIPDNALSSFQWYSNAAGTATTSGTSGIILSISGGATTHTLTVKVNQNGKITPAGTYYFRQTIDGIQSSNVGALLIKPGR